MKELFEEKRPQFYRVMKYWGKKPHNIWQELINLNSNKNDYILDPFLGSGVSFVESLKIGRKPIGIDINPLSHFCMDVYSQDYEYDKINKYFQQIVGAVKSNRMYKENYITTCSYCRSETDIYNYIWSNNKIVGINYKCNSCNKTIEDKNIKYNYYYKASDLWQPEYDLNRLNSISQNTIKGLGGNDFRYIWTTRNFEILKIMFDKIMNIEEPYKKVLVFCFLQTLHLTSKMCAVRGKEANRPLSTSWGRPAYMALAKYMEQNPIIQFERALKGKTGLLNGLYSFKDYLSDFRFTDKFSNINEYDGVIINRDFNSLDISNYGNKIDFIITDPPYGNIIQYNELSLIWNLWLIKAYDNYKIDLENEIIITNQKSDVRYENLLNSVIEKCYFLLKNEKQMIITFNSKKLTDWEILKRILYSSRFEVIDFYLQKNLRSSEANVKAKEGIGISDYYIVLRKNENKKDKSKNLLDKLDNILIN